MLAPDGFVVEAAGGANLCVPRAALAFVLCKCWPPLQIQVQLQRRCLCVRAGYVQLPHYTLTKLLPQQPCNCVCELGSCLGASHQSIAEAKTCKAVLLSHKLLKLSDCRVRNNFFFLYVGNGEMNNPPEHTNIEELVGLSPRSDVSDDYLAGASPQMSEDEDAAEPEENPPDNMPESSHPSFLVSCSIAAP